MTLAAYSEAAFFTTQEPCWCSSSARVTHSGVARLDQGPSYRNRNRHLELPGGVLALHAYGRRPTGDRADAGVIAETGRSEGGIAAKPRCLNDARDSGAPGGDPPHPIGRMGDHPHGLQSACVG
jgi:hypothetical protein